MLWVVIAAVVFVALAAIWRPIHASLKQKQFHQARQDFHWQRERLEARFLRLAAARVSAPRVLWQHCEFADDVTYARDRRSHRLCALVALRMAIEAPEAIVYGDDDDAVPMTEACTATAVFYFDKGHWQTHGRTVFNLAPVETLSRFKDHFVVLGQELAPPR